MHNQFRVLWFAVFVFSVSGNQVCAEISEIKFLLPHTDEIQNWMPEDEPQIAAGDDLYLLINGGAQIYMEYGFKQTIYQTYVNENHNRINLEIYEMKDTLAAYGMYSFKTNTSGEPADIGTDGWMSEYYLNFWKGPYVVTLISLDAQENLEDELIKLARVVEKNIHVVSARPGIIYYLPEEELLPNGLTYIRGNLALMNQYVFATQNIFSCTSGVAGRYSGYTLFLLEYIDTAEAEKWHRYAMDFIRTHAGYAGFADQYNYFQVYDHKQNLLRFTHDSRWIMIFVGTSGEKADQLFTVIRANLSS